MRSNLYLAALLLFTLATPAAQKQAASPGRVKDCAPCVLHPGPTSPPVSVYFHIVPTETGGKRVEKLEIRGSSNQPVVLNVTPDMDIRPIQNFFLDTPDINFDGFADLMLVVSQGTANVDAEYWIYGPATQKYVKLGTFPVFRVDAEKHELTTHENDGEAGRLFHDATYMWTNGNLAKVREVIQTWNTDGGGVFRIIRENQGGKWTTISNERVTK